MDVILRNLDFIEDKCDFYCDYKYNNITNETIFEYSIFVNATQNKCHTQENAIILNYFYIRLSCECQPLSERYLNTITKSMQPYGNVGNTYWVWTNLNILPNKKLNVKIILNGNIKYSFGDMTFGGDSINGYSFCTNNQKKNGLPNPCHNKCQFGQWTKWKWKWK